MRLAGAYCPTSTRNASVDMIYCAPHIPRMPESTTIQESLASALRERRTVIADRKWYARDPAGHLDRLRTISEQITTLQTQLPPPVNPRLAHFLERCSYDKALAFLEGRGEHA